MATSYSSKDYPDYTSDGKYRVIGTRPVRHDGTDKVTGRAIYGGDVRLPDLLYGKEQDSFVVVNGRIGISGPDDKWGIDLWAQNLFDTDYTQVAFNTPFVASQQVYSAYLAEPRTYGVTVRAGF